MQRNIRNQEDYFLGGRRFGKLVQTFAAFGVGTSADTAVGVTTTTFSNGASGIWSGLSILFATPVYWLIAPWYRRLRLLSLADFFEERYHSARMAMVYALIAAVGMMGYIALGISAMSKTVLALTPKPVEQFTPAEHQEYQLAKELSALEGLDYETLTEPQQGRLKELRLARPRNVFSHIDGRVLICIVCAVVLVYGMAGGLRAAFLTDTIQGIFILVLSVLLLPFAWSKVNAAHGGQGVLDAFRILHERLPGSFFEVLGSPTAIDFTWYYIAALSIMLTIHVGVDATLFLASGAAKDEFTARFGFVSGSYMKRLATVLWGVFALFAIVLYRDAVGDPDQVFGYASRDLLAPIGIGLVGLMIACLMAALMSSADCLMITASNLLTRNVYRPLLADFDERHYVRMGRVIGAAVVIGGAVFASLFENILTLMKFLWEFNAIFAATFWLGILWRPATRKAAWASILVSITLFFILPALAPVLRPNLRTHADLVKTTKPRVVQREYTATEIDVADREEAIARWEARNAMGQADGPRPERLETGQPFGKTYRLPAKAIFWTQGVQVNDAGVVAGSGMLNLALLLIDGLGLDLSRNSHALNETLRIVIRIAVPFLVLLLGSKLTRAENEPALDRFYVKMKTRVTSPDREADARQLALSYADPRRFDHMKLFPGTGWEFCRWQKVDAIGFVIAVFAAVAIVGMLALAVSIGA